MSLPTFPFGITEGFQLPREAFIAYSAERRLLEGMYTDDQHPSALGARESYIRVVDDRCCTSGTNTVFC